MRELKNHCLQDMFRQLPEPHRSNCLNSISFSLNIRYVASCVSSAVLLLNWNCGFAPYSYYENLYNQLSQNKIDLMEVKVLYY